MKTHRTISRALVCLALAAGCLIGPACTKPDKPKELREIEALWQDPATRKVKDIPGAGRFYREARQFRYDAGEAYNDGDVEQAREYAIWSKLRYRTALAIAKQYQAKERLDAANAKVAEVNPELTALNQARNKLQSEVADLERQVAVAKRQREAEDRRRKAMSGSGNISSGQDQAEKLRVVDDKIQQVERARADAVAVNAAENAPAAFNRAQNQLKSLRSMRSSTPVPYQTILSTADSAIRDFQRATEEARPGYKTQLAKADPAARREALATQAQGRLGAGNVIKEGATVRLIAPASFDTGSTSFNATGQRAIADIADLAKTFDEFSLSVEAYTSRGDPTENLGTSQLRARTAADALVASGIERDRVSSKGHGQDRIRYPDSSARNERVEVVFRR